MNLSWVVLVQGNWLRIYPVKVNTGVGRGGRTETYTDCYTSLLADKDLSYLWLLYSAEALSSKGSLFQIIAESKNYASDLADQLRERIYGEVVPRLARGIADARGLKNPDKFELERTYEMALTVLFRLLFVAYAEDSGLLPLTGVYGRKSLKQKTVDLADFIANDTPIAGGSSHWKEVSLLWRAIDEGNSEWGVPAYNGGLFSEKQNVSHVGAAIAGIDIPNSAFEPALRALLVTKSTTEDVPGPVDFSSLNVREFGTIYEGLLESELALADENLTVDKEDVYIPARKGDHVEVKPNEIYLHNRSGARKSSGSFYTKQFAVDHLLKGALDPALSDHFNRLESMDDTDAAAVFFDFRVADISMGSGHFLVSAIDRIEKGMADYMTRHNLPGVRDELSTLRDAATSELGDKEGVIEIEDGILLRRLIARRCIYGVDLNALSVQLAKLAVWIHTFVPGLPLSLLDHTLVHGNSLVGIGTIDDIRKKFSETDGTLFSVNAEKLLGKAKEPLRRLANVNDTTPKGIAAAHQAMDDAREATRGTEALCDLITAGTISSHKDVMGFSFHDWERLESDIHSSAALKAARHELKDLNTLHFPIAFPEVFLRPRPGFDVVLGNPPWQEAMIDEHAFWARHFPGLRSRSLSPGERDKEKERLKKERPDLVAMYNAEVAHMVCVRKTLIRGDYPGMGTGDPDPYKAFCWRFWRLTASDGGRIGVALPRGVFMAKGSAVFRRTMLEHSACVDISVLLNNRKWVFSEVHAQYTLGLVCISHGTPKGKSIHLRGPYASLKAFNEGVIRPAETFEGSEVCAWSESASLPLLSSENSIEVFAQLRKAPRLDLNKEGQWRARPYREMDATQQKWLMDMVSKDCPKGFWLVYKGSSFNIWESDTGTYNAYAAPEPVIQWLQKKRVGGGKGKKNSPHTEFPLDYIREKSTLSCYAPRIAFRNVSRATDTRTVRACLLPPKVFITNAGPYFLWPRGDEKDQAFLLGVLSSIPLDWYARRIVEANVNFHIINSFPIPRPKRDNPLWQRTVKLAGQLACPDNRFKTWVKEVGVDYGTIAVDKKQDMIHELDAVVAHLYGLSATQLTHIFETFHVGWKYQERLDAVLKHYRTWNGKL